MRVKITKSFVERTNSPGKWKDSELLGFGIKITPKLKKVYIVETSVHGSSKKITITIGPHGVWTNEKARIEAKRLLTLMSQGINPNEEKKKQREKEKQEKEKKQLEEKESQITLQKALDDYLQSRGDSLKENTRYIYRCVINADLNDWLELPIKEITKEMVEKRHRKITQSGRKGHANHVMRVLRAIMSYATISYTGTDGQPILETNPVTRLSQVKAWNQLQRRQGVIKHQELSSWYAAVQQLEPPVMSDLLEFLLFTGLRKSEAARLLWKNVDFKSKTILIPDTKNRQPHMLPITERLEGILKRRKSAKCNELVFPSPRYEQEIKDLRNSIAKVSELSGIEFSAHDLRRTFITIAENRDVPYYAIKRLANHKDKSDVTVGYIVANVERLREPMEKISKFIESKI